MVQRHKGEMSDISGDTKWLQSVSAIAFWHRIGHIRYSLRRLANWTSRNHFVSERIDRDKAISVLKPDIDLRSIARRPDPMRQFADRNGCDLGEVVGAEHLDLIEPADRDIGKSAFGIVNDVDVVGNRSRIDGFQDRERRMGIKHLRLANVLQREPDLLTVWRSRNIRAERAQLGDMPDNLVIGDGDYNCLRSKGRADIAIFTIR